MLLSHQKPRLHALLGPLAESFSSSVCEISQNGILAIGNHEYISLVDSQSMELIQTLHCYEASSSSRTNHVQIIRWSRENYHHDLMSPYMLRLASSSSQGVITVWDIVNASVLCEFRLGNSGNPVLDMHWLEKQDSSHDLLLALHNQSDLVLWNADTGTQLWRKLYMDPLYKFSIDPFDTKNLVFLSSNSILLVNDFTLNQAPISNGRKFYVSGPDVTTPASLSRSTSDNLIFRSTQLLFQSTMKLVKGSSSGDRSTDGGKSYGEIVDVLFHKSLRSHLIMVYPREIMLVDTLLSQTVAAIAIDANCSPFIQVYSCLQGDFLFCLHANGCITFRGRQPNVYQQTVAPISSCQDNNDAVTVTPPTTPPVPLSNTNIDDISLQMKQSNYKLLAQSDAHRLSKHIRLAAMSVNPRTELDAALLTSDGKVQIWTLQCSSVNKQIRSTTSTATTTTDTFTEEISNKAATFVFHCDFPIDCNKTILTRLAEVVAPFDYVDTLVVAPSKDNCANEQTNNNNNNNSNNIVKDAREGQFHFSVSGYHYGLMANIAFVRMCPVPKKSNASVYKPQIALASKKGHLQIWHLGYSELLLEMLVMSSLHGIQWLNDDALVAFTHTPITMSRSTSSNLSPNNNSVSNSSSTGGGGGNNRSGTAISQVKNELCIVDMKTRSLTTIREGHSTPESPIVDIRVSHFKQYMAILFEEKSLEIWDTKTLTLLYDIANCASRITLFEWTNSRGQSVTMSPGAETTHGITKLITYHQENIVLIDRDRYVHLYQIEGPKVSEKSKIPVGGGMNRLTALAWKDDHVALGDCDGNVLFWNLKAKLSQNFSTSHGFVRKMKFAPGKGSKRLLVMQMDALEVWDMANISHRVLLKLFREHSPVVDVEWIDSANMVSVNNDCVMRVLAADSLNEPLTPINMDNIRSSLNVPALLPPKIHFLIQILLQHQPERECYSLTCPDLANRYERVAKQIDKFFHSLQRDQLHELFHKEDLAGRCLLVALLFGDEYETRFWSVMRHVILHQKERDNQLKPTCHFSLGLGFDCLTHSAVFRAHQTLRVAHLEEKKSTTEQNRRCVEALIMLGKREHAIRELLNATPDQPSYITDVYKACLLSSLGDLDSTITPSSVSISSHKALKTAAVNFISNGELSEGVQLLCSIGLYNEACHYLMSYQKWDMALWLAKCAMDSQERANVLQKWAQHLRTPQINEKTLSILVLLLLGKHREVLENLYSLRHFGMATRYLEACLAHGLLEEENLDSLKEAIFLEFARQLMSLGYQSCALYYCGQAGSKGQQLIKEIDFLIGD